MNKLEKELIRQFGKKDAKMFILAPHKYMHHFDTETLKAYIEYKESNNA
jgi:hypothetical protein